MSNTDFEDRQIPQSTYLVFDQNNGYIAPWRTTASDDQQEVWKSSYSGVPAFQGDQFIELNATQNATTYQNFTSSGGTTFTLNFAHRGRAGNDVMHVGIGTPSPTQPVTNDPTLTGTEYLDLGNFTDGNTRWGYYSVTFTLPTGVGNNFSVRFTAVSAASGNPSVGNFLDNISIGLPSPNVTPTSTTLTCSQSTANLTNTFTNSSNITWHTGPVATAANQVADPTSVPAGTYYGALFDTSTGCYTATAEITVFGSVAPTLRPISGMDRPCSAPVSSTYAYSNSTTGGIWSVSPATIATINPGTGVLTTVTGASGIATITYIVTTGNSCTSTATFSLTVSPTNCTPMPVALISFTAQAQPDHTVRLSWQTVWEKENKQFIIERSKDMLTFDVVDRVSDVAGNSNAMSTYRLIDSAPYRGTSYYRLIQVDQDGSVHMYRALPVILDGQYGISPNPITSTNFTLELDEPATADIHFSDLNGHTIALRKISSTLTSLLLSTQTKLSTGVYVLTVTERDTTRRYRLVVP